tara:strand:- start:10614 stop:12098 length:1485 start_codon:yes stop_codon:yes gene_type:complete
MDQTIVSTIINYAELHPDKLAIITGLEPNTKKISYGGLSKKILQASGFLSQNGVSTGNVVILSAPQSLAFIVGYFATHLLGAIAVPVDPQLTSSQIQYISDKCKAKIAFLDKQISIKNIPKILSINSLLNTGCNELVQKSSPKLDYCADILFTSGTTGKPKGVILTHENIFESANNINAFIKNTSNDLEVIPSPLSHSFGLARLRCNFLVGATIALANGFLLPGKIYKQLKETKATGISFVPAGAAVLFKFGEDKLAAFSKQLKYIEMGSSPMPIKHKEKLMQLLPNTKICMHYGSTEASRTCFIEFHQDKNYLNSVGKVTPGINLKIQDSNGRECEANESGEIMVSGKSVSKEYILSNMPMDGDWFMTGDYGYRNEQNYIFLDGRKKDLINVGGRKVSPIEIENAINLIPSILDCACIGVPDPKGISGEVIKAFLVLNNCKVNSYSPISDVNLVSYLRKNLEPYKIPSEFKWINKIPKTSSGKIQRDILRKSF